jgi:hypothetical protein
MKTTTLIFSFLLSYTLSFATGLRGTYTIDNSGSTADYTSFRAALKALSDSGVSGNVIFNIADGTYHESVTIPAITGASDTSTITFQSASMDSSKVKIDTAWVKYGISGAYNTGYAKGGYALCFNGCKYITIRNLTITNHLKSTGAGVAIFITNKANHNILSNNVLNLQEDSFTFGNAVIGDNYNYLNSYNTIGNNRILGGDYSITLGDIYNSSSLRGEQGNVISGNIILPKGSSVAVDVTWQDMLTITKNNIYGNGVGLLVYGCVKKGTHFSYITNNFISGGHAFHLESCAAMKVSNNTFIDMSSGGYAVTLYSNVSTDFYNNIVACFGGGGAVDNYSGVTRSDHNAYFTTGSIMGAWSYPSLTCATLADYQKNSKTDLKSVFGNPYFVSATKGDLHLTNESASASHRGLALSYITDDIDGEKRNTIPNIGADETKYYSNDAGISPTADITVACTSTKDVIANVFNYGSNNIDSLIINWSVNGTTMSPVSYATALIPGSSANVKLGTVSFSGGGTKNIRMWTVSPNGGTDSFNWNDTSSYSIHAGLNGTLTIGGASPDFKTFSEAVTALNSDNLCGAVIFNVRDGVYNDPISISSPNTSASKTVTFQSESLDSTKVTLGCVNNPAQQTLFIGSKYITFRKMTISYTFGSYSGDVIQLAGAEHLVLENNILRINKTRKQSYTIEAVVDADNAGNNYQTIRNNRIIGGMYGIEHAPDATETGNSFLNNIIDSSETNGMNINYQTGMLISGNRISPVSGAGIAINNTSGKINSYIVNNFVKTGKTGSAAAFFDNTFLYVANNSFCENSYSSEPVVIFASNSSTTSTTHFTNNILANFGNGVAVSFSNYGTINSDYNDLYTKGSYLGLYNTTNCAKLSNWQTASGGDANSVSGNPGFVSVAKGNLHCSKSSTAVAKKGTSLTYVTTDIDGEARSATTPDIGADEFDIDSNDVGISAIIVPTGTSCGSASTQVQVKLHNFGTKAQAGGFNIHTIIGGTGSATYSLAFADTLNPGQDTVVSLGFALNTSKGGVYYYRAYTDLSGDLNNTNDSASASDSFNALPDASFSIGGKGCLADSFTFSSAASAGSSTSFAWNFGDGSVSASPNPTHLYKTAGLYTIINVATVSGGCTDSSYKAILVDSCYNNLSGKVSSSHGGSLALSPVYAIAYNSADSTLHTIGKTLTDSSGNYSFSVTDSVVYLVAYPDSASYPSETVTWRDSSLTFQNASAVKMTAPSYRSVNFRTLRGANTSGTGFIDGKVSICSLCKKGTGGTPAWGLRLILVDAKGLSQASTYTDINGNFSFGNLPLQDYSIYVDKPLVENNLAPKISLTATNSNRSGMKFLLYPTYLELETVTGVNDAPVLENNLNIYPNPFQNSTNISYSLSTTQNVKLEVFDMVGRSIATLANQKQIQGNYTISFNPLDLASSAASMYILRMTIGEQVVTKELMLVK